MTLHNKLWQPSPERVAQANLTAFAAALSAKHGEDLSAYPHPSL